MKEARAMRARYLGVLAMSAVLAFGAAGCGGDDEEESGATPAPAEETNFEAGSKMAQISERGSIKIGVKKDQPGIGFQEPGADEPTGFDIEVAKIIAAKLGIEAGGIEWVETVSKNREPFLQNGTADLVLASYRSEERRVGQ